MSFINYSVYFLFYSLSLSLSLSDFLSCTLKIKKIHIFDENDLFFFFSNFCAVHVDFSGNKA